MARRVKINPDKQRRKEKSYKTDPASSADWHGDMYGEYFRQESWGDARGWEPTEHQRRLAANLAGLGLNYHDIARILQVGHVTLLKHLTFELEEGQALAKGIVANKLFNHVMAGSLPACIYWMRSRVWLDTKNEDPEEDLTKLSDEQLKRELDELAAREDLSSQTRELAKTLQSKFG